MPSTPRLLIALAALSMTAACSTSPPRPPELPKPLPAEYAVPCPVKVPLPQDRTPDELTLTLKAMYDLYGECAGRMYDLIDWLLRERPPQ